MGKAPEPALTGEAARASVLETYGLDALEDDPELAQITQFAAALCEAPIALVSLVESERQRFLARAGLEERETPRPTSFCAHAMLQPEPMVVPDAALDPRFDTNPLVTGHPHIRFYAGVPLISHEGAPLGSLCVIDTQPRADGLTTVQMRGLEVMATSVMRRLRHRRERLEQVVDLEQSEKNLQVMADSIPDCAWSTGPDGMFDYFNQRWYQHTGSQQGGNRTRNFRDHVLEEDRARWHDDWQTAIANGTPYDAEFRVLHHSGEYRWMLARGLPVRGANGQVERWFGTFTDVHDQRRRAEERDLLSRELTHRIKNIFAVIGGLVALKSREYPDAAPFAADMGETLQALNRAHSYVTQDEANNQDTLQGLIKKLMRPYGDTGGARFSLTGDTVPVSARSATPLALVFHELATNCAKYGAFSAAEGHVGIAIIRNDDDVRLEWRETGGPAPKSDRGTGFGSRLVDRSVSSQLSGTLERSFPAEGMIAVLTVPVSAL
ncbi:MAG: PAS domain-containing protein [Pontixanthobacter sp.]